MIEVNVTEFRNHLQEYLGRVSKGEEVLLTARGKVVARMSPVGDQAALARERLSALRATCRIGDVVTPVGETWQADHAAP